MRSCIKYERGSIRWHWPSLHPALGLLPYYIQFQRLISVSPSTTLSSILSSARTYRSSGSRRLRTREFTNTAIIWHWQFFRPPPQKVCYLSASSIAKILPRVLPDRDHFHAAVFQYSRESLYSLNAFTSLIFFWAIILLASLFSVVTRVILRVRKLINNNDRLLVASALLLCLFSTYLIYALSDVFGGRGQLAYIVTGASHILLLSSGCLSPLMLVTVWWASLWNDSDQFFVSQKNMTRIIAALLCAMWCVTVIQHITETKGLYGPPTFVIMILLMVACSVLAVYFGIKFARRLREASKMTAENGFSRDKKWAKQLTSAIRKTGFVVAMMATAFVLVFPVVIAGMSTTITLFFAVFLLHLLALTICFVMLIVIIPPFSKLWQQKQWSMCISRYNRRTARCGAPCKSVFP